MNSVNFSSENDVRVSFKFDSGSYTAHIREATLGDISPIQELYYMIYHGKYSLDFATNSKKLKSQIENKKYYLHLVAYVENRICGGAVFFIDEKNRLAKAAGVVVLPQYRNLGLATALLKSGIDYLVSETNSIDVIYATTRTINEAPSKVVKQLHFVELGIFPNVVRVEDMEHLLLHVFFTKNALEKRRQPPLIFGPFNETYSIVENTLPLGKATIIESFESTKKEMQPFNFKFIQNEKEVVYRYKELRKYQKIANSFFPFHLPNTILKTKDGNTEIFAWMAGKKNESAILGYRTDRTNLCDLLDSASKALYRHGASYVELLVNAYDYNLQKEAFFARFIPSAYFPAMTLSDSGFREDYFVLSRTFNLLDFSSSVLKGNTLLFLKAYLRRYYELYLKDFLEKSV